MRFVIYHANCIDGFTAAWAAYKRFGTEDTCYIPASYGDPPPSFQEHDSVLIVDFSYPRPQLEAIRARTKSIIIYDHHKTAAEALKGFPGATFDMERSGAGITWDELNGSGTRSLDPFTPWLIDYVEDRDLWRFQLPHSKEVNAWIGACSRDSFEQWDKLAVTPLGDVIVMGRAVLQFVDRYVAEMCAQARLVSFEEYDNIPIVNAPYINISELVGKLAENALFAIGWSQRADGNITYSLRSRAPDGIDVSAIAKRFGGGGHKHAAGFLRNSPKW